MNRIEQLHGDLRFVRAAMDRADRHRSPATIYLLWAVLILCGFALVDLRQAWVPWYWRIAGPAGFLASAYLGWRHARTVGQMSVSAGSRHLLHWGGMLIAIFLVFLMPINGLLRWDAVGPAVLLILAVGYFHAGVHLDRALLWIGGLMGAGYLFVIFVSAYAWTGLGVVLAIALAIAGLRRGSAHEAAV